MKLGTQLTVCLGLVYAAALVFCIENRFVGRNGAAKFVVRPGVVFVVNAIFSSCVFPHVFLRWDHPSARKDGGFMRYPSRVYKVSNARCASARTALPKTGNYWVIRSDVLAVY